MAGHPQAPPPVPESRYWRISEVPALPENCATFGVGSSRATRLTPWALFLRTHLGAQHVTDLVNTDLKPLLALFLAVCAIREPAQRGQAIPTNLLMVPIHLVAVPGVVVGYLWLLYDMPTDGRRTQRARGMDLSDQLAALTEVTQLPNYLRPSRRAAPAVARRDPGRGDRGGEEDGGDPDGDEEGGGGGRKASYAPLTVEDKRRWRHLEPLLGDHGLHYSELARQVLNDYSREDRGVGYALESLSCSQGQSDFSGLVTDPHHPFFVGTVFSIETAFNAAMEAAGADPHTGGIPESWFYKNFFFPPSDRFPAYWVPRALCSIDRLEATLAPHVRPLPDPTAVSGAMRTGRSLSSSQVSPAELLARYEQVIHATARLGNGARQYTIYEWMAEWRKRAALFPGVDEAEVVRQHQIFMGELVTYISGHADTGDNLKACGRELARLWSVGSYASTWTARPTPSHSQGGCLASDILCNFAARLHRAAPGVCAGLIAVIVACWSQRAFQFPAATDSCDSGDRLALTAVAPTARLAMNGPPSGGKTAHVTLGEHLILPSSLDNVAHVTAKASTAGCNLGSVPLRRYEDAPLSYFTGNQKNPMTETQHRQTLWEVVAHFANPQVDASAGASLSRTTATTDNTDAPAKVVGLHLKDGRRVQTVETMAADPVTVSTTNTTPRLADEATQQRFICVLLGPGPGGITLARDAFLAGLVRDANRLQNSNLLSGVTHRTHCLTAVYNTMAASGLVPPVSSRNALRMLAGVARILQVAGGGPDATAARSYQKVVRMAECLALQRALIQTFDGYGGCAELGFEAFRAVSHRAVVGVAELLQAATLPGHELHRTPEELLIFRVLADEMVWAGVWKHYKELDQNTTSRGLYVLSKPDGSFDDRMSFLVHMASIITNSTRPELHALKNDRFTTCWAVVRLTSGSCPAIRMGYFVPDAVHPAGSYRVGFNRLVIDALARGVDATTSALLACVPREERKQTVSHFLHQPEAPMVHTTLPAPGAALPLPSRHDLERHLSTVDTEMGALEKEALPSRSPSPSPSQSEPVRFQGAGLPLSQPMTPYIAPAAGPPPAAATPRESHRPRPRADHFRFLIEERALHQGVLDTLGADRPPVETDDGAGYDHLVGTCGVPEAEAAEHAARPAVANVLYQRERVLADHIRSIADPKRPLKLGKAKSRLVSCAEAVRDLDQVANNVAGGLDKSDVAAVNFAWRVAHNAEGRVSFCRRGLFVMLMAGRGVPGAVVEEAVENSAGYLVEPAPGAPPLFASPKEAMAWFQGAASGELGFADEPPAPPVYVPRNCRWEAAGTVSNENSNDGFGSAAADDADAEDSPDDDGDANPGPPPPRDDHDDEAKEADDGDVPMDRRPPHSPDEAEWELIEDPSSAEEDAAGQMREDPVEEGEAKDDEGKGPEESDAAPIRTAPPRRKHRLEDSDDEAPSRKHRRGDSDGESSSSATSATKRRRNRDD